MMMRRRRRMENNEKEDEKEYGNKWKRKMNRNMKREPD
jgi:hypothetical protein